ncbi:DUF1275 family protein [Streptomyces sp. NPDC056653]|uniref:DUF1275 family protein n=1 Tax=Streptomyces sp. NPDC056653 TaxID=3345894 RepID=UPI00367E2078
MTVPVLLREAWATLVPDMTDRHGPLPPLMVALTVVTGLVDAVSHLQLGAVFVADMTGNVVFSGFAFAGIAADSQLPEEPATRPDGGWSRPAPCCSAPSSEPSPS